MSETWAVRPVDHIVKALKKNQYRWYVLGGAFEREAERRGLGMPCRFNIHDDGSLGWCREGDDWNQTGKLERRWMDKAVDDEAYLSNVRSTYKVGDKVWCISTCYPGGPDKPAGTPYRMFICEIEDEGTHVQLGHIKGGRGNSGMSMSRVHHDLFVLIREYYSDWYINSPVDVTWPGSDCIGAWRSEQEKPA